MNTNTAEIKNYLHKLIVETEKYKNVPMPEHRDYKI